MPLLAHAHKLSAQIARATTESPTACTLRCRIGFAMSLVIPALILVLIYTLSVAGNDCTSSPPHHVDVECRIWNREVGRCFTEEIGDRLINECDDRFACRVSTGIRLEISCGDDEDVLQLFKDNVTFGARNVSWPFASAFEAGLYECRDSSDGSVVSFRSITVDEGVYVLSGSSSYEQTCRRDLVPDHIPNYDCNVARNVQRFFGTGTRTLWFNVLGVRPIDLSIDVIWANHYPVDLHLLYDSQVNDSSTPLHSVTINSEDLVFVGEIDLVRAYVVITANDSNSLPSTMCVIYDFHGVSRIFHGDDLPVEVMVSVGDSATFYCEASTEYDSTDAVNATVAFLVRAPESRDLMECLNCSFSATELSSCSEMVNEGTTCSGLEFVNSSSSSGDDGLLIHNLTAQWNQVETQLIGYEVVCAIAVDGVTQWANTATLIQAIPTTVIIFSPTTSTIISSSVTMNNFNTTQSSQSISDGAIAGIIVGGVVLSSIIVMVVVIGIVLFKQRTKNSQKGNRLHNINEKDKENLE